MPIIIGTEVNIYEQKNPWHIKAERWLMGKTDRVVVSAESVRDFYVEQVGADREQHRRDLQRRRLGAAQVDGQSR